MDFRQTALTAAVVMLSGCVSFSRWDDRRMAPDASVASEIPSAPNIGVPNIGVCGEEGPIDAMAWGEAFCWVIPSLVVAPRDILVRADAGEITLARDPETGGYSAEGSFAAICEFPCAGEIEDTMLSEWGVIAWDGEVPTGTDVRFQFKMGGPGADGFAIASSLLPIDFGLIESSYYPYPEPDVLWIQVDLLTRDPSATPVFREFSVYGACVELGCAGECIPGSTETRTITCAETVWSQERVCGHCRWKPALWSATSTSGPI